MLCYSDVTNDLLLSETRSEQVSDRGQGISGPGEANQRRGQALLTNERPGNVIISVMRVSRCCHDAATLIPGPAPSHLMFVSSESQLFCVSHSCDPDPVRHGALCHEA